MGKIQRMEGASDLVENWGLNKLHKYLGLSVYQFCLICGDIILGLAPLRIAEEAPAGVGSSRTQLPLLVKLSFFSTCFVTKSKVRFWLACLWFVNTTWLDHYMEWKFLRQEGMWYQKNKEGILGRENQQMSSTSSQSISFKIRVLGMEDYYNGGRSSFTEKERPSCCGQPNDTILRILPLYYNPY